MITPTQAILLRYQLALRCACGEPATRYRIGQWPKSVPEWVGLLPTARVQMLETGAVATREDGCDAHAKDPPIDTLTVLGFVWRDHPFAQAVRALNDEARRGS